MQLLQDEKKVDGEEDEEEGDEEEDEKEGDEEEDEEEGKSKKSSHQPKAKDTNQEKLYLLHMDLCGPMHVASINGKRRNWTLVEAAHTILIFSKALLFLWVEAINTACYIQNGSLIRLRYNKTPYEIMQEKKPDLYFFHVFGALCYPTNDNDDLGKLDAKADIGIFVGYAPAKKAFRIYNKGFVPNTVSQQPCILPNRDDWDHLFQPMFDEYFNPPTFVVSPVPVAATPRAIDLVDSPVSTPIDQDALSEYLKDTNISLTAYADADHAGCHDTRRSTSGSAQFLGDKLVSWSSKKKRALQSRVQRHNILPYLSVGLKSYRYVHN
nr:retrovirus-related Pol polyprotein from transposon TNT 1-94 [Tanacetum cinerariifolium]